MEQSPSVLPPSKTRVNTSSQSASRFLGALSRFGLGSLKRDRTTILQINVGKLCNQACKHCHVEAGPKRTEIMDWPTMERLVELAAEKDISLVDITGGAPEMNPHFRQLIEALKKTNKQILVRCNLTILLEPGQEYLPEFYAENGVQLVCSLPCYTLENVENQRGTGVFSKSIEALKRLNQVGYGKNDLLELSLVYNPGGAFLPGSQSGLEADYRRELKEGYDVVFTRLLALANLPIGRFAQDLSRSGGLEEYMELLDGAFNPATMPGLMCRNTLSVGWDGRVYDCDFNQMLEMEISSSPEGVNNKAFSLSNLENKSIALGDHCLGCTAGAGSSCGGALS